MTTFEYTFEDAKPTDAKDLKRLTMQMGYDINERDLADCLQQISEHVDHKVIVSKSNNEIVGFIHVIQSLRLTTLPFLEIVAIAVDENHRSNGIGTMLVQQVKRSFNNLPVRVRCNVNRKKAHEFYKKSGFKEIKTQVVLTL